MICVVLSVSTVPTAVSCHRQPRSSGHVGSTPSGYPDPQLHRALSHVTTESPPMLHIRLPESMVAKVSLCYDSLSRQQKGRCSLSQFHLKVLILGVCGCLTVLLGCPAISLPGSESGGVQMFPSTRISESHRYRATGRMLLTPPNCHQYCQEDGLLSQLVAVHKHKDFCSSCPNPK